MISPDLVRARRRGERLELLPLRGSTRLEAERLASEISDTLRQSLGQSEEEIEQLLGDIPRPPSGEKLFAGLSKVILDQCEFEAPVATDPVALRRALFERAATRRRQTDETPFDRARVLEEVASELGLEVDAIERALFSDLRGARLLVRADEMDAAELLKRYELAQVQGVLLRAVRIGLDVVCTSADAYKELFRKLKFRRLLHRIQGRAEGGYHIEVDGPFSLFESVTKYGLALAQLVPVLERCQSVELTAELRWGSQRLPLAFRASFGGGAEGGSLEVRDEVQALVDAVNRPGTGFTARLGSEVFDLPGVGVLVPDLALEDARGRVVYVEVMGYWSREAVFRRLDWLSAQGQSLSRAGSEKPSQPLRLLLAVSSQLRVSPDAAPPEAHGALYVYKGTLSAKALLRQAQALAEAPA